MAIERRMDGVAGGLTQTFGSRLRLVMNHVPESNNPLENIKFLVALSSGTAASDDLEAGCKRPGRTTTVCIDLIRRRSPTQPPPMRQQSSAWPRRTRDTGLRVTTVQTRQRTGRARLRSMSSCPEHVHRYGYSRRTSGSPSHCHSTVRK